MNTEKSEIIPTETDHIRKESLASRGNTQKQNKYDYKLFNLENDFQNVLKKVKNLYKFRMILFL